MCIVSINEINDGLWVLCRDVTSDLGRGEVFLDDLLTRCIYLPTNVQNGRSNQSNKGTRCRFNTREEGKQYALVTLQKCWGLSDGFRPQAGYLR